VEKWPTATGTGEALPGGQQKCAPPQALRRPSEHEKPAGHKRHAALLRSNQLPAVQASQYPGVAPPHCRRMPLAQLSQVVHTPASVVFENVPALQGLHPRSDDALSTLDTYRPDGQCCAALNARARAATQKCAAGHASHVPLEELPKEPASQIASQSAAPAREKRPHGQRLHGSSSAAGLNRPGSHPAHEASELLVEVIPSGHAERGASGAVQFMAGSVAPRICETLRVESP
jgi:hypothetical protein